MRIFPVSTCSPPNFFTPKRRPAESRPLRELPPAFLCAIAYSFFFFAGCFFAAGFFAAGFAAAFGAAVTGFFALGALVAFSAFLTGSLAFSAGAFLGAGFATVFTAGFSFGF